MALARQIAGDLMQDATGLDVTHLNLVDDDGHGYGGWCREAVIERIYKHLIGELPK